MTVFFTMLFVARRASLTLESSQASAFASIITKAGSRHSFLNHDSSSSDKDDSSFGLFFFQARGVNCSSGATAAFNRERRGYFCSSSSASRVETWSHDLKVELELKSLVAQSSIALEISASKELRILISSRPGSRTGCLI